VPPFFPLSRLSRRFFRNAAAKTPLDAINRTRRFIATVSGLSTWLRPDLLQECRRWALEDFNPGGAAGASQIRLCRQHVNEGFTINAGIIIKVEAAAQNVTIAHESLRNSA
jgi:hypothetical protein